MELKQYQKEALDVFQQWCVALDEGRIQHQKATEALRSAGLELPQSLAEPPEQAWENLRQRGLLPRDAGNYIARHDDADRPIPHVCFKVPTGGGKTFLAAAALQSLHLESGLALWITPTTAIYEQTRNALRNRQHPYRQLIETGSSGRVKFLEKDDPLTKDDLDNYLCIMLLSLPAANRKRNRDFLLMFRNSGRYPSLFPPGDTEGTTKELLAQFPDLDLVEPAENSGRPPGIKHSLFNVFKMQRPVVILDEAHKAYGSTNQRANQEYVRAVNQFDPKLVVELSATPNPGISNLLLDIPGTKLRDEEMIKLPVQVDSYPGTDWHHVLSQAAARLEGLEKAAGSLRSVSNRYVRPIAVVRVERTGEDQREINRIHAEDVREYLVGNLGVPSSHVAVQSTVSREISGVDLTSPYSQIRWIITKAALMEGWDCSFAYMLVMLDNTTAQTAITQLVGRVMRQPHAQLTGFPELNQCYVVCFNTDVEVAVERVKLGLEHEGLSGLSDQVTTGAGHRQTVTVKRRSEFNGKDMFLPTVLHSKDDDWVKLDYQKHILADVNWAAIMAPTDLAYQSDQARHQSASVDIEETVYAPERDLNVSGTVRVEWFTRRLADLIPNPWRAASITKELLKRLKSAGYSAQKIFEERSHLDTVLREHVARAVENQAEEIFRTKLQSGQIRFDLEVGQPGYQVVDSYSVPASVDDATLQNYGQPMQISLFEPVFVTQFDNDLERNFARYLDEQKALQWWHRIAMRQRGEYFLLGWREQRIWPDFIAMTRPSPSGTRLLVLDTKGSHLEGNRDTEYKRKVLETLQEAFNCGTMHVKDGPARGSFMLVFEQADVAPILNDS